MNINCAFLSFILSSLAVLLSSLCQSLAEAKPDAARFLDLRRSTLIEPWLQVNNTPPPDLRLDASIWQKNRESGRIGPHLAGMTPTILQMEEKCQEEELAVLETPTNAASYFHRGDCYAQDPTMQRTLDNCDQGLKLDPTNVRAYLDRAAFRYILNNKSGALADLSEALTLAPDATVYMERGQLYNEFNSTNSLSDFNEALRLAVGDAKLTRQLTWLLATSLVGRHRRLDE